MERAEGQGFDVLVTTDQNLKYQQNLGQRRIAIVVLTSTSWPRLRKVIPSILQAIDGSQPHGYLEVTVPADR